MCTAILVNNEAIETIGELAELIGEGNIVISDGYTQPREKLLEPDLCLCPVDIEATSAKAGYQSVNGMLTEGDDWFMGYKWKK